MSATARIDAQLLYWTRLPPGSGTQPAQLDFRFERVLPVPVDQLHVVRAPLPDGGALLVGIEPARLREHLAGRGDVTPDTWELIPDRTPPHHTDLAAALPALNLLQGSFEPERRRRARRMRDVAVAGGLVLALVLALVGIERRVAARAQAAEDLRRAGQELLVQAVGPASGRVSAATLLTQELRRLEQAARGPAAVPVDAAAVLQRLWAAWPSDLPVQVETVSLTPDRLVLRGAAATLADVERIATATPVITVADAVFRALPFQAEQTPQGAAFLLTWQAQDGVQGRAP